ncbi:MAG: flagellar export chaperone FlgN [bacterium]
MTSKPFNIVSALVPAGQLSVEVLGDSLSSETKLIEELTAIMRRQRAAVAIDDLQGVDDTVFATHRVLITLSEARRRRHAINRMLGEREDISVNALEDMLGPRMTERLIALRDGLQDAARTLSREVATNRQLLRQALANSDAHVRTLTGAPGNATYATPMPSTERTIEGVLLNRRA